MTILLNKLSYSCPEMHPLELFLKENGLLSKTGIALAINDEVVPRSQWNKIILQNKDKLTVIGATAGG